jgi:hypothetical protein
VVPPLYFCIATRSLTNESGFGAVLFARPRDPFGCLKRGSGHNDVDRGRISLKAQGAGLICYLLLSAEVNPDTPRGMLPARLEVFIRRRQTDFVVSNDQEDSWYFRAVIS